MKKLKTVMVSGTWALLTFLWSPRLFAVGKFSWNFADCDIRDIIYAVSVDSGISIACDETVSGKSDFKFVGDDFESAFDAFARSSRLYVDKQAFPWLVSRIRLSTSFLEDSPKKDDPLVSFDVIDVFPPLVLERLSLALNFAITYDSLPSQGITVHLKNQSADNLIKNIVRCMPGYEVTKTETGYHIFKSAVKLDSRTSGKIHIKNIEDGRIEVDTKNVSVTEILEELFLQNQKSFCVLSNSDVKCVRATFVADNFDKALELVCSQNGFTFNLSDGVYYITSDTDSKDELFNGKKTWEFFQLNFTQADKAIALLSRRFGKIEAVISSANNGFWALVNESTKTEIEKFLVESDVEKKTYLISLKNIKADEFIARLPPSIEKSAISLADGNCCLYFTGTQNAYENVLKEIELCDKPVKRLKYDLLILQYEDSSDNMWASNFSARKLHLGDATNLSAQLGSVMGFNLNVVTAFGLDFAAQLQASINENKTKVFADTSLHGVAGKQISFANTNTYRYRDNNLDPETGKPVYSGVTREIVSGLKLDVQGWVGEDGMITSTVTASVTRRGTDTSSATGNPPPTTEKIVTTEVRGKSGEPVVLSGLVQNSESDEAQRTPGLSKIPLLGNLFKSKKKTIEKTQMIIYLVPFIDGEDFSSPINVKSDTSKKYDEAWAKARKEKLCEIMNSN